MPIRGAIEPNLAEPSFEVLELDSMELTTDSRSVRVQACKLELSLR